ncbi:hypothetical protein PIB30_060200 [Stylosanthes scabra]|uniref:Uncharacterized protein n=1 Tax=Stylosanthes scabra TaxID=79078 RepID=A0ABU6XIQ5_9FABA|nr:hypothetical protein [Stylosanthes scabra]
MDRMDDQLSFLCYSNQMANEQMLFPYQNTSRQFKEMEMQGIPVTMANLAIHRQREEKMNQERMRYDQILQEVAAQQAREANKGKTREIVLDSEEEFISTSAEAEENVAAIKACEEPRLNSKDQPAPGLMMVASVEAGEYNPTKAFDLLQFETQPLQREETAELYDLDDFPEEEENLVTPAVPLQTVVLDRPAAAEATQISSDLKERCVVWALSDKKEIKYDSIFMVDGE